MTDIAMQPARSQSRIGKTALRWLLYVILGLFALYYLMPLFVMVTTSLKSLEEIRTGDLISLPREVTFDAWVTAWSKACTGIQCEGVRPFFWNSVLIAVTSVSRIAVCESPTPKATGTLPPTTPPPPAPPATSLPSNATAPADTAAL